MNAESGYLGGSRLLQILRAFGEYMREPVDQTGVAVCGADCRQDAGSGTAKRGHAAGAAQRRIIYPSNVTTGKPDFLYVDEERPLILEVIANPRIYLTPSSRSARSFAFRVALRTSRTLRETNNEKQDSAVVPCVIIYPEVRGGDVKFDGSHSPIDQVMLEVVPIGELVGFYRMGSPLPVLSAGLGEGLCRGAGEELLCVGRGWGKEVSRAGA